jgi:HYDIN/CFA65/VesB family protein/ASPM-SPD-2-Hydin domain-containing protein/centrosomal CEP192-like protein/flagellar associated PapD-like protein
MASGACQCSEGPGLAKLRAEIELMPASLDFGEVPLGATQELAVSVHNKGSDALHVCLMDTHIARECAEATRIDPMDAPFAFRFDDIDRNTNAWIVEKGQTREFTVTFTPVMEGAAAATLILSHNAQGGPTTKITLSGKGVQPHLDFSTDMLDFGEVTVGTKKTLTVTLTNTTQFNQPVTIAPIVQPDVIFGTTMENGTDTAMGNMYQGMVPGNGKLDLKVWYRPPDTKMDMNTLHLTYCASPLCAKDISVKGVGVKPLFQIMPATLDFGAIEIGSSSMLPFTIKNVGNVNLTVNQIGLTQGTSMEFSPMPQGMLPAVLPPTMSLTVQVTFAPHMAGDHMGRVEVDTSAWDDPMTSSNESTGFVELSAKGSGASIAALPPSVNFGTVAIGSAPVSRNLIIENSGNAALTVTDIQLNSGTGEITMTNVPSLPAMLAGGASIQLSLQYAPTNAGLDMASVVVTSSDRGTPMLNVPVSGIGGIPTTCSISISPSQMTFGLVERGRTVTLPAEIRNAGMQPCNVMNVHLMGMPQFGIASGGDPMFTLPPGGVHRVDVTYTPDNYGMHNTLLEFQSDDPAQMMVQVPVSGASSPSALRVVPSTLDFGVVPATCRSPTLNVTLYNTGNDTVTINQVYLDPSTSAEFELQPYSTPQAIAAGGSSVINIRYHPANIGMDSGVLFIVSSISPAPIAVPLLGDGEVNTTVTDTFQQVMNPKVDVLFVVDDSGSMEWAQSSLASNLSAFVTQAQTQNADYHIAATTTDVSPSGARGAFIGSPKFITNQTPNAVSTFANTVRVGTNGDGDERGLEAAYLALSDPQINTTNAGFLRNDAALAVILVSDDDDSRIDDFFGNPGGPNATLDPGARTIDFYVNFFRNIKGFQNTSAFSFNAVVELAEDMCVNSNDNAEAMGYRYMQVAMRTGGIAESICSQNWGQTLTNIGLGTFGLKKQFQLSSDPVPVTISVTVNGMQVQPPAWSYDMASNSVVFTANSAPPPSATITITYTVKCN